MRRRRRRGVGHESEGGRAVLAIVLVVLVLVLGGWVAAYAGADGKVPRGTRIAGVEVGGKDRSEAVAALARGFTASLNRPITVTIGTMTAQVTAAEAGISVAIEDSLEQVLGPRSWDPRTLWGYYVGGAEVAPLVQVDATMLSAAVARLDSVAGRAPVDGAVSVASGQVQVTQPRDGAQIEESAAGTAIAEAWAAGLREVDLPLALTPPDVDSADVSQAVAAIANPAISAPVTLTFATSQVTLNPRDYSDLLTITPRDGALALDVDSAQLETLVEPGSRDIAPVDATVAFLDGAPHVVPAVAGAQYDAAGVTAAFQQAVVAQGAARTAAVQGVPEDAAFATTDAEALGITDVVGTFSVAGPATPDATLDSAAALLTGTILRPGETFSFNGRVGDAGPWAAQLATATWNAGLLAGLADVARTASSTFTGVLPEGRDVSVAPSGPDLQLRNDSTHGMLLAARSDSGSVVVDVWSTKESDIATATGPRYALTPAPIRQDADPACVAAAGSEGFSVDLTRSVSPVADPASARVDTVTTTYAPQEAVVCTAVAPVVG